MNLPGYPPELAGRFAPVQLLASGGFGHVFLVKQVALDRPVALKVLSAAALVDAEQMRRFEAEARVTASLTHPHIVVVLEFGVAGDVPWIAYELLPGRSLRDALASGALDPASAVGAVIQVAAALEHAHARGVVHRDIKADNVLELAPGHYKVADFGIARWAGSAVRTDTGVILGTPLYIAPELVQGAPATPATDLYALGVLTYELLAGRAPFVDDNPVKMLGEHVHAMPPMLGTLAGGLPGELESIVMRALAKRPGERPTVAAFREELERLLPAIGRARPPARPTARGKADTIRKSRPELARTRPTLVAQRGRSWGILAALTLVGAAGWAGFALVRPPPAVETPRPTPAASERPALPPASPSASARNPPAGPRKPRLLARQLVEGAEELLKGNSGDGWGIVGATAAEILVQMDRELETLEGGEQLHYAWVMADLGWVVEHDGLTPQNSLMDADHQLGACDALIRALPRIERVVRKDPVNVPVYFMVRYAEVVGRLCEERYRILTPAAAEHRAWVNRCVQDRSDWIGATMAAVRDEALHQPGTAAENFERATRLFVERYFEKAQNDPPPVAVGAWYRLLKVGEYNPSLLATPAPADAVRRRLCAWAAQSRRWTATEHHFKDGKCDECTGRTLIEEFYAQLDPAGWCKPAPWPHAPKR